MLFTELSEYLHRLRFEKCGRAIGYRMTAMEIWDLALACKRNGITKIYVKETVLPPSFDGTFVRMTSEKGDGDVCYVYLNENLPSHWKEFVIAKELMHCWSPGKTYIGEPERAGQLVQALTTTSGKYTASVAADVGAIVAAAEVMLPIYTLERDLAKSLSTEEIASRHNLHPDVAKTICSIELMHMRKNGCL
ncbi:hypothetical protein [Acetobacter malorum]|nr:hypothetical protein [Acetobacter malorum]